MHDSEINLSKSEEGDITILKIEETRVDSFKAPSFKTELLKTIADGSRKILLNFEHVQTMDSSGMGALTFGKRQIEAVDGELAVCGLQEKVSTVFKIAKLDSIFRIFDTEKDGINGIK